MSGPVFAADQLARMVALLPPPDAHRLVVVGSVDREGCQAVADFASKNGQWHLQAAYRHDWTANNSSGTAVVLFQL
jgi:hypothetical protein